MIHLWILYLTAAFTKFLIANRNSSSDTMYSNALCSVVKFPYLLFCTDNIL